jgi:hypothetical protein
VALPYGQLDQVWEDFLQDGVDWWNSWFSVMRYVTSTGAGAVVLVLLA